MKHFLVFDIETGPTDWELLSDSQKKYWLQTATSEEEIEARLAQRALTPLTGKVLCIGLMIVEYENNNWNIIKKGVLASDPNIKAGNSNKATERSITEEIIADNVKMQLSSESKVLEDFWKILSHYKNPTLITFNGRGFDVPFLMLRSAVHKIRPPFNLMQGTKFNYPFHIDLIDELTFFSPSQLGATKKFNFDFYAHAFGITSPKAQGVDGSKVPEMFAEGRIREISEYCMRDVKATWELFVFWTKYLCFKQI